MRSSTIGIDCSNVNILIIGFPRTVTTRLYVEAYRIFRPCIAIYEPLNTDSMNYGRRGRRYIRTDILGKVPNIAPIRVFQVFHYYASRFHKGKLAVTDSVKLLKFIDRLLQYRTLIKTVFTWALYRKTRYQPRRDIHIISPIYNIELIYRGFREWFLEYYRPILGKNITIDRNLRRLLHNIRISLKLDSRFRTGYGLYSQCRYLCGRLCSRELDKILPCLYAQYLDTVDRLGSVKIFLDHDYKMNILKIRRALRELAGFHD